MNYHITFIVLLFLLISCEHEEKKYDTITVMTYNIHHGVNNNGEFDLDAIAKVILNENPDFVALQEVDSVIKRSNSLDLSKVLAQKTKMNYVFGKATQIDNGLYGVTILSKHKIISSKNIPLPHQTNEEPRTALTITSALPFGDTISFISTHLDYRAKNHSRIEQIKKINKVFTSNKYPTILAGDLNDIPGSQTINEAEKKWTATYNTANPQATFPSLKPEKKIDYILSLPTNKWKKISSKAVQDSIASDHRPYVATIELIH